MWFKLYRIRRKYIRRSLAGTSTHYQAHKAAAVIFITQRLQELNQAYGFTYQRVTIKNQATRWGSCSKQGNLNFHYKVALLPTEIADYVLVHELCHLQELNHSKRFWQLVERTLPNYRLLRRALRTQSILPKAESLR